MPNLLGENFKRHEEILTKLEIELGLREPKTKSFIELKIQNLKELWKSLIGM